MLGETYQLAIIAVILLGIGVSIWKGGAANPEGTGTLGRRVNTMSNKISAMNARISNIEIDIQEIKQEAVTGQDLAKVGGLIDTLRAEVAGDRKLAERTQHSLDRIERLIIERGLGK